MEQFSVSHSYGNCYIELDKAILAKLTRKGYNIANEPPLFHDLDTLYQATREIDLTSEL